MPHFLSQLVWTQVKSSPGGEPSGWFTRFRLRPCVATASLDIEGFTTTPPSQNPTRRAGNHGSVRTYFPRMGIPVCPWQQMGYPWLMNPSGDSLVAAMSATTPRATARANDSGRTIAPWKTFRFVGKPFGKKKMGERVVRRLSPGCSRFRPAKRMFCLFQWWHDGVFPYFPAHPWKMDSPCRNDGNPPSRPSLSLLLHSQNWKRWVAECGLPVSKNPEVFRSANSTTMRTSLPKLCLRLPSQCLSSLRLPGCSGALGVYRFYWRAFFLV